MPRHLRRHSAVSCAKTVEPIEMPFGLWTGIGARKHVLDRVQILHAKGHADDTVALMGDRLAKIYMGRKVGGGCCAPLRGESWVSI